MYSDYFPLIGLLILALSFGIVGVTSGIDFFTFKMLEDPALAERCRKQRSFLKAVRWLLWGLVMVLVVGGAAKYFRENDTEKQEILANRALLMPVFDKNKVWVAPDEYLAETDESAALIQYGRDIIIHTQDYFGENGLVRPASINNMNCQNCHLEAGAKPYGNNYFAVESTYPQMRPRSGGLETIPKRVNDCFERSLNGQPLDTTSREMKAILAYMRWLGTGIPRGERPKGQGLVEVPFLKRPANPSLGQKIYAEKCASCHGSDGQGMAISDSPRWYPPLWGDKSYNEAAGLFRMSRLAGYVKANMPFGASFKTRN